VAEAIGVHSAGLNENKDPDFPEEVALPPSDMLPNAMDEKLFVEFSEENWPMTNFPGEDLIECSTLEFSAPDCSNFGSEVICLRETLGGTTGVVELEVLGVTVLIDVNKLLEDANVNATVDGALISFDRTGEATSGTFTLGTASTSCDFNIEALLSMLVCFGLLFVLVTEDNLGLLELTVALHEAVADTRRDDDRSPAAILDLTTGSF